MTTVDIYGGVRRPSSSSRGLPLVQLLAKAAGSPTRLTRANGCDQPVSARGPCPKAPATGERVCRVAAAAGNGGDTFARVTLQQQRRGGGVG